MRSLYLNIKEYVTYTDPSLVVGIERANRLGLCLAPAKIQVTPGACGSKLHASEGSLFLHCPVQIYRYLRIRLSK